MDVLFFDWVPSFAALLMPRWQIYSREAIRWSYINYDDNQPCIELFEASLGIFALLDEVRGELVSSMKSLPRAASDGLLYPTVTRARPGFLTQECRMPKGAARRAPDACCPRAALTSVLPCSKIACALQAPTSPLSQRCTHS